VCGDGHVDAGEDCDDGNNFGGDGCAANCTSETSLTGQFDPTKTMAVVQTASFAIGLNLTGSQTYRVGKMRDTDTIGKDGHTVVAKAGDLPVVIRAEELKFDPVKVAGTICACVRGIPVQELFGAGVSAAGAVGCGTDGLTDVDYRLIQDHNTNPGDPNNMSHGVPDDLHHGSPDDATCTAQNDLPGGAVSKACKEQTDTDCLDPTLHIHPGVCNGPRQLARSGGTAGRGSAFIVNNTAIGQLADNGTCDMTGPPPGGGPCPHPDYGHDCLPCTPDDVDLGIANNLPTTTGTAEAADFDANNGQGIIDTDQFCGGGMCSVSVTGSKLDCDKLIAGAPDALSGGSLAVSFPNLDAKLVLDNVTTTIFFNK